MTEIRMIKRAFTLIELVAVVVILGILAAILVPIISGLFETAHQATDNANARLIYNAAAMWYAENNTADASLTPVELKRYLGLPIFPAADSAAFGGSFSVAVDSSGKVTVMTDQPATYDPAAGKLKA